MMRWVTYGTTHKHAYHYSCCLNGVNGVNGVSPVEPIQMLLRAWDLQELIDAELKAIKELRRAYCDGVRKSYFQPTDDVLGGCEEVVQRCLVAVARIARTTPEIDARASLIVLPTGLGKTGVMCALPFMLPLKHSR